MKLFAKLSKETKKLKTPSKRMIKKERKIPKLSKEESKLKVNVD